MTHLQLMFRETFLQDWARCTIAYVILCSGFFSVFIIINVFAYQSFFGKGPILYVTYFTEGRVGLVYAYFIALIFFSFYTIWHMQLKINFRCIGLHGKKEVGRIL